MEFEGEAFISYAHLDNLELVEGRKGWVANFHRALEVRVAQLLGKPPQIWRDPKLSGNDLFADTLVEKLKRVAVLVSVVSPRYLKSEWTLRELTEFWHAAETHGGIHVGNRARVFKVLKTPVPLDKTPPELRMLIGYEFFRIDPDTGKIRELDEVFGSEAQRDFWIKLDDLAHDMVDILERLERPDVGTSAANRAGAGASPRKPSEPVYLAESTSDVREHREAIKRDLLQQGYDVLPDYPIPHVADEACEAVRSALARSCMSIHPIGRNYGVVPEGGQKSLIELQHELAAERATADNFSRLIWIPDGVRIDDERQRHLVERIRVDPRIGRHADLLETEFEDLRTAMRAWLNSAASPAVSQPQPPATSAAPPRLYLMADVRDGETIAPWADQLFDADIEIIRPLFGADESELRAFHEEALADCDGVLIFYGSGNELWLRRKLREVQKSAGYGRSKPAPLIAICLIPPRTPEKERFRTHEAVVVPQWEGCALDALAPFVAQLKAGRSV